MSAGTLSTIYAVNVRDATAALIDGVIESNVDPGSNEIVQGSDGSVDPYLVALGDQEPRVNFTTVCIKKGLDQAGFAGKAISTGADFFLQKLIDGGTRGTTLAHLKMVMAKGLIIPVELSAEQGGLARLSMQAICAWNGTNDPLAFTADQSLLGTVTVGECFTVGPVSINGSVLAGVQRISLAFGIQVNVIKCDGDLWPSATVIMQRRPVITLRTYQAIALNTFGLKGAAQAATDSTIFFRKKEADGVGNVAEGTAAHIKISVAAGRISVTSVGGSDGSEAMADIRITPRYNGSDAAIVVATASAIS